MIDLLNEKVLKTIFKKVLRNFNIVLPKKINGINFKIPIFGGIGVYNLREHENYLLDLLKLLLKDDNQVLFVDVGVNIGQTLLKVKSINPSINYIGFEPNPTCNYYVEKLISINSLNNTRLMPFGVSSKNGVEILNFYNDLPDDSSASMISDFRENEVISKSFVPTLSVSQISNEISFDNMKVLKVDVEGMELEVIKSFKEEIRRNKPFILLEILPVYDKDKNINRYERQEDLFIILNDLEYTMFRIIKSNQGLDRLKEIVTIEVHSNLELCDYIFIPKEELKYFKDQINS